MKTHFTICLILCSLGILSAQRGPYHFAGAGQLGAAQIGLLAQDAEAVIALPALLADRSHGGWTAGVSLRPGLDDLGEYCGAIHFRLPWKDHIGLSAQSAGIDGYREQRFALTYARKLFGKLNAGVQFDYHSNTAEEYESLNSFSWAISFHAPLMKQLSLGAYIYNPLGVEDDLDLPSLIRLGVLYMPSEKISVAIESEKDWRHEARFTLGLLYQLHPRLHIRWGVGTSPSTVHAGISYAILNHMHIHGGWRYQSNPGSSFAASVSQYRAE